MGELMFVNVDHPSQLSNSNARRRIRSHISRRQHEQKRMILGQAVELQKAMGKEKGKETSRFQAQGSCDDYSSPSQHDSSSSSSIVTPAGASDGETERIAILGSQATYEPGLPRVGFTGSLSNAHDRTRTTSGADSRDSKPNCLSCAERPTLSLRDYDEQHALVLSTPQSTGSGSAASNGRQQFHRGESSSRGSPIKEEAEEEEDTEHVSQLITYDPTTSSKSHHASQSVSHAIKKHSPTPRIQIHFPLTDPTDDLQTFARTLGMNVTAMLNHFYKVFDVMATTSEPSYGLPSGYMRWLWESSMRAEPAARAAILFSSAVSIHSGQGKPSNASLPLTSLHKLRGHALSSIRSALDDPKRRGGDAVLVAVLSVAESELLCGWWEEYEAHRRGLAQIRRFRGESIGKILDAMLAGTADITVTQMLDWNYAANSRPV